MLNHAINWIFSLLMLTARTLPWVCPRLRNHSLLHQRFARSLTVRNLYLPLTLFPSSLLPHFRLFFFLTLCPLLPLSSFSSFFKSHDLSHPNYSILDSSTLSLLDLTHYEAIFKINPHNLMFYSVHGFIAIAFTHSALP